VSSRHGPVSTHPMPCPAGRAGRVCFGLARDGALWNIVTRGDGADPSLRSVDGIVAVGHGPRERLETEERVPPREEAPDAGPR